ncbi:hypothetical protein Ais01nite_77280 [Asanoa ishikariensis]|uniref:ATPase family associated with various cellular activities (AAA) n=2 Tax=Asanoa ishikariensis TaxID=137265 RepID=A0A1H3KVE1_9ACTN|nr:hypothetical protein Ais01nite_77280 [Asanoa ishikariensis]SDY55634.1 ATPase family associated with various cellular activities (AAA) [Asanoa ishikariensis]
MVAESSHYRCMLDGRTPSGGAGDHTGPLGRILHFDDMDVPSDVVDALALSSFVSGDQPWARTKRLDRVRAEATLLPADAKLARVAVDEGRDARLAVGEGWTVRAVRWRTGGASITVTAVTEELAESVLAECTAGAIEPATVNNREVEIGFWHQSQMGPTRTARNVACDEWPTIRDNYETTAGEAIDRLAEVTPETVNGRLLIMHGSPGTGKTTALRALARAWRDWCQVDVVIDPQQLFTDPGYLAKVASGGPTDSRRWRLLLLEDSDDLIRADGLTTNTQQLSRLLNLTDGLLGQGGNVIVAVTTNEKIGRLHPAVLRPGRCMAQIEVGPLPYEQATAWLGSSVGVGAYGATLAELLALREGRPSVATPTTSVTSGFYL